jgi:hypothetical protein
LRLCRQPEGDEHHEVTPTSTPDAPTTESLCVKAFQALQAIQDRYSWCLLYPSFAKPNGVYKGPFGSFGCTCLASCHITLVLNHFQSYRAAHNNSQANLGSQGSVQGLSTCLLDGQIKEGEDQLDLHHPELELLALGTSTKDPNCLIVSMCLQRRNWRNRWNHRRHIVPSRHDY